MMDVVGPVWWLLVALGLLITFHEFGHYWVARRCGVRVLRFSIGFGAPLWKRVAKDGTEWVVAWLPLGGYVRMLDEREGDVAPAQRHLAFNTRPVWQRIAIVVAGPLANLLMCVALLWLMFVVGKPDLPPQVSVAAGPAAEAGLREGDLLMSIGERATPTMTDVARAIAYGALDRAALPARVRGTDGRERTVVLPLDRMPEAMRPQDATYELGLYPYRPARVGVVAENTAATGRLEVGDLIVAVDGEPVASWYTLSPRVQAVAGPGRTVTVTVERSGRRFDVELDPKLTGSGADAYWQMGVGPEALRQSAILKYGPLDAVPAALKATREAAVDTLGMLKRLVLGRASLENISGPITIARVADVSADIGAAWFLNFLALLSLGLCIMNLLPIPVLDGGHLLYYLIELVKGSPVGERVLVAGQYVGLVLLAGLMGLAFYNDLFRPAF